MEEAGTRIVSVEEELALQAKAAAMLERPVGGAISLRGGIISWQGSPAKDNILPCIVLDSVFENRYYTKPFNAENPANPVCFALSREEKDLFMHEDSEEPQGAPESTKPGDPEKGSCAGCPKGAWGSDPRGGRGKACSQIRRLVLAPASAAESPQAMQEAELAILKLPVTSTRYWAAYVNQLATGVKRPVYSVVTEITTEPHPKHQFHVYFNMAHVLPLEMIDALRAKVLVAEKLLFTPYAVQQNAEPQAPSKKY